MNRTGFAFALIGLLFVSSCTKPEEQPSQSTADTTSKDAVTLSSQNSIVLPVEGGSATISFTASGEWTAALANERGSWLSISPASGGKDEGSVTVSAQANPDTDDRSAVVLLTCGKASARVTVTQKQKDALTQTPSKTQFGAEGGSFTIEVKANIDYSFEIEGSWIHKTTTRSMTTRTTTFTVDKNDDTRRREGSVTVKSSLGSEKVTIYQEATAPSIILSADKVPLGTEGGTFTVDVNTNVDVTMVISAGSDWLSEVTTKAMSTHSYTFQATANESYDVREGVISFKNEEHGIEARVTVTQMQKDAIVVTQPVHEIGANGGSISIEAAANVDLTVQISESWVRQAGTRAMTAASYDFEVDPNPGYDVRECVITFSAGAAEQENGFTQTSSWSVIGTIGGDVWTRDIEMKTDGTWHVAYGVAVSSSDEFKFRRDKDWDVNLGYAAYQPTTVAANTDIPLWQDGVNIRIDSGTYDMYLNPSGAIAYIIPSGGRFPYGNEVPQSGALSATVTIRQDGADGFIADFQDRYTLSAREQSLELNARATVEVEAHSQADWITVTKTRAFESKSIVLQIAENTDDGSRTGKVTVSAPALGISEDVTIVQVGAGDIYIPDNAFRALLLKSFDKDSDGILSKPECEAVTEIQLTASEDARVIDIESIQGIEYFSNLNRFGFNGNLEVSGSWARAKLAGTLDFSANTKLSYLNMYNIPMVQVLDLGSNPVLYMMSLMGCEELSEIVFPEGDELPAYYIVIYGGRMGPELDLSRFPDLNTLVLSGSQNLQKVWLRTGVTPATLSIDNGIEVGYKGEDVNVPATIQDPVFKKYLVAKYDTNNDGIFSVMEAKKVYSINIEKNDFHAVIAEGDTLKSFAGISVMENLNSFTMIAKDWRLRVKAEFIEEFTQLRKLYSFSVDGYESSTRYLYGHIPEGITDMPNLQYFKVVNCAGITGQLPVGLFINPSPYYVDLTGCSLESLHVTVPASDLLNYPDRETRKYFYALSQHTPDGNNWSNSTFTFRSSVDGTGPIHPDGEVVVYNQATAGHGVNIIITGDGFTAENNTVGGTLETYLIQAARTLLDMDPFSKIKDHLNVYLVYAHSQTEGSESESTKFGAKYEDPREGTTVRGNHDDVMNFLKAAGLNCSSATIAVIMNSPYYAGTDWMYDWLDPYKYYSIGYVPVSSTYELTFIHEIGGHGFGKLSDEYGYEKNGYGTVPASYWIKSGDSPNVDSQCGGDPTLARWAPYYLDSRYASEKLGAYLGGATYATGTWRPTDNSVMRWHQEEGGDVFNAPSRESIWLRAMFLSRDAGITYPDWQTFYNAQNREDFVSVDLAPAPDQASAVRTRELLRRQAARRVPLRLPDGSTLPEPKHTPPQRVME